jgi:hypothetical protein
MPLLNLSQAARLAGVDVSIIRCQVERGELATTQESTGECRIDAAELARLYPGLIIAESRDQPLQLQYSTTVADLQARVESLQMQLQAAQERERWYQERIQALEQGLAARLEELVGRLGGADR